MTVWVNYCPNCKNGYVKLIDVENINKDELDGIDTTFSLTEEEFNIATGGK